MRYTPGKADANGVILNAGPACQGFMLAPGVPSRRETGNAGQTLVPGSFPVRVRPRRSGDILPVRNSHALYFAREFPEFDLLDCDPGDCWDVYTFDSREEGIMLSGAKAEIPVHITDAVALATANPTLATDGWPLRPNLKNFSVYYSGTPRVNRLWVRRLDLVWFDTGIDYDQTATTVRLDRFEIGVKGDRWTLIGSAGAQNVVVEGSYEVG